MREAVLTLEDETATVRLGGMIAAAMARGDVLALGGELGVGKSVLARAAIRHFCPDEHDIPSPTFTLAQRYEPRSGPPVMHFDLYRLEGPLEAVELGIEEAFAEAITLVEWPRRLGPMLPEGALEVTLAMLDGEENARTARMSGVARWNGLLERAGNAFGR